MSLLLAALAAFIAALIQRVTGMGFVLVLLGPVVLLYGALEGGTIAVLLALIAALVAVPIVWRDIEWPRAWRLIWPGLLAAPFGALLARLLPEPALLLVIAAMAAFALIAAHLPFLATALRGRAGARVAGAAGGFMNASSGLGGPALAAHAVGDHWGQRSFAATVQVVFVAFNAVAVPLRGFPTLPTWEVTVLAAATVVGIIAGTLLHRAVPTTLARRAMLTIAWAGAAVVLIRGILALWA